jgi:hypothetical protein
MRQTTAREGLWNHQRLPTTHLQEVPEQDDAEVSTPEVVERHRDAVVD